LINQNIKYCIFQILCS